MKKLLLLSLVAFYICVLLLVNSCDKDIEKVPLNIHVQGLVLQTSDDGFTYIPLEYSYSGEYIWAK